MHDGLTDDVMDQRDDHNSLFISQNLVNIIENESRDHIYNNLVAKIRTNDMSNKSIVENIN